MQLREVKLQEASIAELTQESKLQEKEEPSVGRVKMGEASSGTSEHAKSEGDMLAEKLEQEQRKQAQQRAKLKEIMDAFRKGET